MITSVILLLSVIAGPIYAQESGTSLSIQGSLSINGGKLEGCVVAANTTDGEKTADISLAVYEDNTLLCDSGGTDFHPCGRSAAYIYHQYGYSCRKIRNRKANGLGGFILRAPVVRRGAVFARFAARRADVGTAGAGEPNRYYLNKR